ncbi:MAG: Jag N-terminal domain-containing protein [Deltaproteobacteria bacterium]|nr:Jag N-terminal domain-containing protein [Deltaproteobacteria bacterium]
MKLRVEEKSLELAMVKAAGQLGVTQGEMSYRIIREQAGLFGLFGKKVCIEAWERRKDGNEERERAPTLLNDKVIRELKEDLREFCATLCHKMYGRKVKVRADLDNERLVLDINDDSIADQLGKSSLLAEALEHIIRKKPRHLRQELPFRIFVDAKSVRVKREKDLIGMAKDLSRKVHENQKPVVLNYRSPYDRKIIHMALDQDQRVYTKSVGVGQNRKLMILPTKEFSNEANG